MRTERFYLEDIKKDLNTILEGTCDKVFFGFRPKVYSSSLNDFVVVVISRLEGVIQQSGTISFDIACKNKPNGVEDIVHLQEITNSITSLFPIIGERYTLTSPYIVLKGGDDTGFSHWVISSKLKVNVIDSHAY